MVGRQYSSLLGPNTTAEIVGVLANVLKNDLLDRPQPEIYTALGNSGALTLGREINLVVRTTGDPVAIARPLRSIVHELDPSAPVHNIDVLSSALAATAGEQRFTTTMLSAFAALALAAVGLYGVLSCAVSRRRRELGIRAALGATPGMLVRLVVREGLGLTTADLLVGVAAALASARLMRTLLFGVDTINPLAFLLVPVLLIFVSLVS